MEASLYMRCIALMISLLSTVNAHSEILGPELISNDEMPVTLNIDGQIYALSGDVTGNITITGDDVTINLNQYVVTGRIIISGQRALIYGGKVIAPAPADNVTADAGVIQINAAATNAQILDCYISAADTTLAGVRGARGIQIDANNVIIARCFVLAGSSASVNGVAVGGNALVVTGQNLLVESSQAQGGNGSVSNSASITSGAGGKGIDVTTDSTLSLLQSMAKGGNAGLVSNGANGITIANGGDGITIDSGAQVLIHASEVMGGDSSIISGPTLATTAAVTGGDGGYGINSLAAVLAVSDTFIQGGNVGDVVIVSAIGSAAFSFSPGNGGTALYIDDAVMAKTTIRSSALVGGNAGSITTTSGAGTGINNIVGDFFGATAGYGVEIVQQAANTPYAIIEYCDIKGGLAPDITSASGLGSLAAVFGNSAGDGIVINNGGSCVDIAHCTIVTFKGGDVIGVTFGNHVGGNGGNGILVGDIFAVGAGESFIRMANNQILAVGGGGNAPGVLGTGGGGGYGILVGDNTSSIEVTYNTITNSPGAGSGGSFSGQTNYAILVGQSNLSVVYGNLAYGVAPAVVTFVYFFANTVPPLAIDAPNGTVFAAGTDRLANIYQT